MLDDLLPVSTKKNQFAKRRRRSFRSSCREPAALAMIFSGLVLLAYSAGIIGVVLLLDQHQVENSTKRHLQLVPGDEVVNRQIDPSLSDLSSIPPIPPAKWPVSLRDEINDYEVVQHPVDAKQHFRVPKFWTPPLHNNQLMSRETAMRVGSCTIPNAHGNYARGADCPLHQRTIFIMIASYRDYQCRETIESLYSRAAHPERIRVGVVDQIVEGVDNKCHEPIHPCSEDPTQALCQYAQLIDTVPLDAKLSVGPVPARHIGHRMYRGEYYAAQSDAHVTFTNNWEMALIHELESTGNEMAVLSTYLSDFVGAMDNHGNSLRHERPIMCNSYWKEWNQMYHIHHSTQPESAPAIHGMPQLHPWWAAGFSFARGHFTVNVPYDYYQPMVFSGEEMSIAIRGWTVGYDYYTPEHSVCFHHYAESAEGQAKRADVPTFWENAELYKDSGVGAMKRLLGIVHLLLVHNETTTPSDHASSSSSSWDHTEEDVYGLGNVRTPEQLMRLLGIDVPNLQMQGHLCQFVNRGTMHQLFVPHLRDDGMGINYDALDYQWKDPDNELIDSVQAEKKEDRVEEEDGDDAEGGDDAEEVNGENGENERGGDDGDDEPIHLSGNQKGGAPKQQ